MIKKKNKTVVDETKVHPALTRHFGYCFFKAALRLKNRINKEISEHGLMNYQLGILDVAASSGPLNQLKLGEEMGIDKTTMVKLIDDLEAKELVERTAHPTDRRVKLIRLSVKGLNLMTKVKKRAKEVEQEFLSPLSEKDLEVLKTAIPLLLHQTDPQ